jgi:hypothetical protein
MPGGSGPRAELTAAQRRALDNVNDALEHLQRWHGKSEAEIEADREGVGEALGDLDRTMVRALRARLARHPLVARWIAERKGNGDWRILRRARSGAEKGIKRPMTEKDLRVWAAIDSLARRNEEDDDAEPCTQIMAYRYLRNNRVIPQMRRQAFRKLLARLDLLHRFPHRA